MAWFSLVSEKARGRTNMDADRPDGVRLLPLLPLPLVRAAPAMHRALAGRRRDTVMVRNCVFASRSGPEPTDRSLRADDSLVMRPGVFVAVVMPRGVLPPLPPPPPPPPTWVGVDTAPLVARGGVPTTTDR